MKLRRLLPLAALVLCANGGPHYQSSPERRATTEQRDWGPWAGPFRDKLVPSLMRDFGERYLYAEANAALPPPAPGRFPNRSLPYSALYPPAISGRIRTIA